VEGHLSAFKAHVLLVNPWIVDFAAYDFWIKPLGLLTIANVLRENNYNVNYLDCLDRHHNLLQNFNTTSKIQTKKDGTGHFYKEHIKKPDLLKWVPRYYSRYGLPFSIVRNYFKKQTSPDIILVTSSMTYWYPGVIQIIDLLKDIFPHIPVVLGGIYATLCYNHAKRFSGADHVVTGEAEVASLKLVDQLTGNNSSYEKYRTLDDYPVPAYDLYTSLDSAAILSSRGCPYNCPVCASGTLSGKYRRRSIQKIIKEITNLHENFKINEFAFYDDSLLYKKNEHIIPLLKKIIDNELSIHFHTPNGIQPSEVDDTVAYLMKTAGFRKINLSYETVNTQRQREFCSKVSDNDLRSAVINLVNNGFEYKDLSAYVLMGLPDQEIREVIDSILFVYSLGIKVSLASFSPIPGTRYWEESVKAGQLSDTTDPLLTNNSIFPLYKNKYDIFISLRTLTNTGNQLISESKNPLNETSFLRQLKNLK